MQTKLNIFKWSVQYLYNFNEKLDFFKISQIMNDTKSWVWIVIVEGFTKSFGSYSTSKKLRMKLLFPSPLPPIIKRVINQLINNQIEIKIKVHAYNKDSEIQVLGVYNLIRIKEGHGVVMVTTMTVMKVMMTIMIEAEGQPCRE